jgi:hypothetical protein
MRNRFRVEIYDANKAHDLTIYSETGRDREHLTELVYSNLRRFQGNVKGYVIDNKKKKKIAAVVLDEVIVSSVNNKLNGNTAKELGLA